jgi:quinoprotein glucose dehydrogenase
VAQATKTGNIFLLDRETGKPLYPVEERPVPQGGVPGETTSPTQPFPTHPPPLHRDDLRTDTAWGLTPWDRGECRDKIAALRNEGMFTPPSLQGSVQFPSPLGGANWGGVAIDPVEGVLYVNMTRLAWVLQIVPRAEYEEMDKTAVWLPDDLHPMKGTPYAVKRQMLRSRLQLPCVAPPWGTLAAVDLKSGRLRWEVTLGTTRDQAPWPFWVKTGSPTLGGAVVTAGGLLFIASTTEKTLRALDTANGEEVWQHRLPYAGNATPMTYRVRKDGRQFVVIAAGGHAITRSGDAIVAFALPER